MIRSFACRCVALGLGAMPAIAMLAGPVLADLVRPAELPPADYAGQQYVDSEGCLFLRTGQPGEEAWIPRVTREGKPLCDNPPSGQRVRVIEEGAPAKFLDTAPVAPLGD